MKEQFAILITVSELVSVFAIVHMWWHRRMGKLAKVLWSLFLLVPILGPLFYAFLTNNPESHDEDPTGGPYQP